MSNCYNTVVTTTTNNMHTAMNSIVSRNQSTEWMVPVGRTSSCNAAQLRHFLVYLLQLFFF